MTDTDIAHYITDTFPEVGTAQNYGYTFFHYGSDLKRPFATMASSDNEYDRISNLDREGVFRLNIGVSKSSFQALFANDAIDVGNYDYTALDCFMPHPEYAAFHFICVLNPGEATLEKVKVFLAEAYELARQRSASNSQ